MKFLIDAQLPIGLAIQLRKLGHEADHVNEVGLGYAADQAIAAVARDAGSVLVSKDSDFLDMNTMQRLGCRLLWIRLGNVSNKALWAIVGPNISEIVQRFEAGELVIEVNDG